MRLPRCPTCGIPYALSACPVCMPAAVERWLIGRVVSQGPNVTEFDALGIGTSGRITGRGRVVAVSNTGIEASFRERTLRLETVLHPGLGSVEFHEGLDDGLPYRVCPIPGEPTARDLVDNGPLSEDIVVGVADGLLGALETLHEAGLGHGAVSLDTVHVSMSPSGGIGRLVSPAALLDRVDARADLAALGWTLGAMLAGGEGRGITARSALKNVVMQLLDPSLPMSAHRARELLSGRSAPAPRTLRTLLAGLVG